MDKQKKLLQAIEALLGKIEQDSKRAKLLIHQFLNGEISEEDIENDEKYNDLASKLLNYGEENEVQVVEGVYDGYFMIGSDEKKYPVPLNYSSKTKLIPGDVLKLRIMNDGKLVYKLISATDRRYIKATLSTTEDNKYIAISDEGKNYYLNQAAVTFFKGNPGDELSIIVNADGSGEYAAIEALIPNQ